MIAINIPTNGGGPPIAVDGSKMPASTAASHWFIVYLFLICLSFVSSLFDRSWDLLPVSCGIPGSRGRSDHFGSCCVTFFFSPLLFYPPDADGFDHDLTGRKPTTLVVGEMPLILYIQQSILWCARHSPGANGYHAHLRAVYQPAYCTPL